MATVVPHRPASRPSLGSKLQHIAETDPAWVRALERLVDWKLAQPPVQKAS